MFSFEPRVRSPSWEEVGVRNTGRCGPCEVLDASLCVSVDPSSAQYSGRDASAVHFSVP